MTKLKGKARKQISMHINSRLHDLFKAKVSLEGGAIGDVVENLINLYVTEDRPALEKIIKQEKKLNDLRIHSSDY